MRILVTRPECDAGQQGEALQARGHQAVLAPLLRIEFEQPPLDLADVQAIIVTSRNALRALAVHPQRSEALNHPVYAVGNATARAATDMGFLEVAIGPGDGLGLSEVIRDGTKPTGGGLLHLSGADLATDLASVLPDYDLRRAILYRAVAVAELPDIAVQALNKGTLDGVILMSPRTARIFISLLQHYELVQHAGRLICYCLSEAVAEAAKPLGAVLRVPAKPREEDILALVEAEAASS